jgi:hypothetical protein
MDAVRTAIERAETTIERVAEDADAVPVHGGMVAAAAVLAEVATARAHVSAAKQALDAAVEPASAQGQRMVVRACLHALIASAGAALSEVDNPKVTQLEVEAVVPARRRAKEPTEGWEVSINW